MFSTVKFRTVNDGVSATYAQSPTVTLTEVVKINNRESVEFNIDEERIMPDFRSVNGCSSLVNSRRIHSPTLIPSVQFIALSINALELITPLTSK